MAEDRMLSDEILLGLIKKNGGGGGTTNYNSLSNKPQIAGTELQGNKSLADLGIASAQDVKKEFIGTSYEWEQLSVEQRKEYDTFQFTDDYSDANYIYLPTIYSTEEKQVGVWTDGKPLYQKTWYFDATSGTVNIDVTSYEIENVAASNIQVKETKWGTGNLGISSRYDSSADKISYTISGSGILMIMTGDEKKGPGHITLLYTKTSDTAGSGIWTPSGQIAEHYSTDEEIVGTWIDGSTIYKRTTECEIPANQGQGYTHFVTSVPLDASVIDSKIVIEDSTNHFCPGGYTPWYAQASVMFAGLDPSGLNVWFGGNHYAGKTMSVTLWYIKATA